MKKAARLILTGAVQWLFFRPNIKTIAEKNNLRGFARRKEDGKIELFIEGNSEDVDAMISLCKEGLPNSTIRTIEHQSAKFQDFKDFRILNF